MSIFRFFMASSAIPLKDYTEKMFKSTRMKSFWAFSFAYAISVSDNSLLKFSVLQNFTIQFTVILIYIYMQFKFPASLPLCQFTFCNSRFQF